MARMVGSPMVSPQAPRHLPEGAPGWSVPCPHPRGSCGEGPLTHTVHFIRQSVNKHQENTPVWQALCWELQAERGTRTQIAQPAAASLLTRLAKAKNRGGEGRHWAPVLCQGLHEVPSHLFLRRQALPHFLYRRGPGSSNPGAARLVAWPPRGAGWSPRHPGS